MDETPEYILMCQKANEIQEGWKEDFDILMEMLPSYFYDIPFKTTEIAVWLPKSFRKSFKIPMMFTALGIDQTKNLTEDGVEGDWREDMVWLPRQDQLQRIFMENERMHLCETLYEFTDWYGTPRKDIAKHTSFERLWLAFIMDKLHNKVWNGEDWVSA